MSLSAPDAVGELRGLRAWRVNGGLLWSLYRPVIWRPGRTVDARCLTVDPDALPHRPPARGCRCGLYAARRPSEIGGVDPNTCSGVAALLGLPSGPDDAVVLGEVGGWGVAEIGALAWRAEHSAIRAIYATHPAAGPLAERYEVPLVALD